MSNLQSVKVGDLTLEIEADTPPAGTYAGDYYPQIRVTISGGRGRVTLEIDPEKAAEIAMALRVAHAATKGR